MAESASVPDIAKIAEIETPNDLSVKEWLLSSGLSDESVDKMLSSGYNTLQLFMVCTQDDIDGIVKEFNLSNTEKLKLKCAVTKLLEVKTDKLQIIDPEESEAMNKMQHKIKLLEQSIRNINRADNEINEQHKQCEKLLNDTFDRIEQSLKQRKQLLRTKLRKMADIKHGILTRQKHDIHEQLKKANKITRQCHRLLSPQNGQIHPTDNDEQTVLDRKSLILQKQRKVEQIKICNDGKPKAPTYLMFDCESDFDHLLYTISKFGDIVNEQRNRPSASNSAKKKNADNNNKKNNASDIVQDEWDSEAMGDNMALLKRSIICNEQQSYCYRTCFGKNVYESGTHHWRLQIKQYHQGYCAWNMLIGVMKIGKNMNDSTQQPIYNYAKQSKLYHRNSHFTANDHGYGFVGNMSALTTEHGVDREYGQKFVNVGDTIDVFLDLKKRTLAFKINNVGYGIAYDDLQETRYCLAVTFCGNKNELAMLKYDHQTYKN